MPPVYSAIPIRQRSMTVNFIIGEVHVQHPMIPGFIAIIQPVIPW